MRKAKIARFHNPAIDYIIILLPVPVQLPVLQVLRVLHQLQVLPVLHQLQVLPVLRVLPVLVQLQELRVLPVLRVLVQLQEPQELPVLLLSWLLPSGPACSLLPRLIKKPIKAR